MSHQVVRGTHQLLAGEAADGAEGIVDVADDTAGVGRGDQPLFGGEGAFTLGDRLVVAHQAGISEKGELARLSSLSAAGSKI
ncbi:hypothetical protein [Pseudomonas denitrificans (nom. rej.)]|uniref:hypothetical protein n=1 Tax=Pseudomonas denitrificans TaxID=43306 RepID=UPI001E5B7FA8|nr:hypothetical protein [Pseudomonas denitrificans (nom. rej.)]